jgi:hypothetical protein
MTITAEKTLDGLHHLHTLYRQGYNSQLINQTIDKLIEQERRFLQRQLADIEARLTAFESRYQLSSADFYRDFRAGKLGDEADFVEWCAFYEMWQAAGERLKLLDVELVV